MRRGRFKKANEGVEDDSLTLLPSEHALARVYLGTRLLNNYFTELVGKVLAQPKMALPGGVRRDAEHDGRESPWGFVLLNRVRMNKGITSTIGRAVCTL